VLNGLRWIDRRGGAENASVIRFVGKETGIDLKKLQQRSNEQVPTPVWKRMAIGTIPEYDSEGVAHGGCPGKDTWAGVEVLLLLIAGDGDEVAKPEEAMKIVAYLQNPSKDTTARNTTRSDPVPAAVDVNIQKPDGGVEVETRIADTPNRALSPQPRKPEAIIQPS
jgi:hypothetical protein